MKTKAEMDILGANSQNPPQDVGVVIILNAEVEHVQVKNE